MKTSGADDHWAEACEALLGKIRAEHPWWFNGDEGTCVGGYVRRIEHYPYEGEECVFCKQHPDGRVMLEAKYILLEDHEPLTFVGHEDCANRNAENLKC